MGKEKNAKFVFMSSVEVFDGILPSYREEIQLIQLTYMENKEISEKEIINSYGENSLITRTSWNISDNGIGRCQLK